MSTIEEQLRAAGRAVAQQVTTVPELRKAPLPAPVQPGRRQRRTAPGRRWTGWAIPVAAMVAIAAVAVTSVVVRNAVSGHQATPAAANEVPRYYLTAAPTLAPGGASGYGAFIGDARTGAVLTRFKALPGREITQVAGAADDRTFVLDMQKKNPGGTLAGASEFVVYQADKAGDAPLRRSTMTLSDGLVGAHIMGITLSPDGSKLAVLGLLTASSTVVSLRVYSISTHKIVHQWTMPLVNPKTTSYYGFSPTWTENGRIEFWWAFTGLEQSESIFSLDVTLPGQNLLADSKVFPVRGSAISTCMNILFTPDGKSVVCGSMTGPYFSGKPCAKDQAELAEYSVATSALTRVLYQHKGACFNALVQPAWYNPSGSAVVAVVQVDKGTNGKPRTTTEQGLFRSSGFTSLPLRPLVGPDPLAQVNVVVVF